MSRTTFHKTNRSPVTGCSSMSPDFAPSLGIVAHQRCIEDEPAARPTRDASLGHLLRPLGKGLPGSVSNARDDERQFARVSRRIENFADPETGRGSAALDRVVLAYRVPTGGLARARSANLFRSSSRNSFAASAIRTSMPCSRVK